MPKKGLRDQPYIIIEALYLLWGRYEVTSGSIIIKYLLAVLVNAYDSGVFNPFYFLRNLLLHGARAKKCQSLCVLLLLAE